MIDDIINAVTQERLLTLSEKTLIVPTGITPGFLNRSIAAQKGSIANLSVTDLRSFVQKHSSKYFPGCTFISQTETAQILADLISAGGDEALYFKNSLVFASLGEVLADTIEELILNDFTGAPEEINSAKWKSLQYLITAYAAKKNQDKVFDYADGVKAIVNNKPQFTACTITRFNFKKNELELINTTEISIIEPAAYKKATGKTTGFKTETPLQEVQMIINSVIDDIRSGIDKPVVALENYDEYYPLFNKALNTLNLPTLFECTQSVPFLQTQPGNLWKLLCEFTESRFSKRCFLRIVSDYSFNRKNITEDTRLFYAAIRLIQHSEHSTISASMADSLLANAKEEDINDAGAGDTSKRETAEKLIQIFAPLTELKGEKLCGALIEIFRKITFRNEENNRLLSWFKTKTEELPKLTAVTEPDNQTANDELLILRALNQALADDYTKRIIPQFNKPLICTTREALYLKTNKIYLPGLNEKGRPAALKENPLISDSEKEALTSKTPGALYYTLSKLYEWDELLFESIMGNAADSVVLSAPLRDMESGREYLLSKYMHKAVSSGKKGTPASNTALKSMLSGNEFSVNGFINSKPEYCFTEFEKTLFAINSNSDEVQECTGDSRELLEAGIRFRDAINNYSGPDIYFGKPSLKTDISKISFSASKISEWVKCPQKFYLGAVLKLQAPEEDEEELQWLNHLTFGNIIHRLFEKFLIKVKALGSAKVEEKHRELIELSLNESIEEYRKYYPPRSEAYFAERVNEIKYIANRFFELELQNTSLNKYTELSFGMPGERACLGSDDAVTIKLKDDLEIKVRGSIDRIDEANDGYILYDYKTGEFKLAKNKYSGGQLSQAGLYPLLLKQYEKKAKLKEFVYYYTSRKGGFEKVSYAVDDTALNYFKKLLSCIITEIQGSNYLPEILDDKGDCKYCEFIQVCFKRRPSNAKEINDHCANKTKYDSILKEVCING